MQAVSTSPQPIVALPPAPSPIHIPLPLQLKEWLYLQSQLEIVTVTRRQGLSICPSEPSYLVTLERSVTLHLTRAGGSKYGLRVPYGMVWPLHERRLFRLEAYEQHFATVGLLTQSALQEAIVESPNLRGLFIKQLSQANIYAQNKLVLHLSKSAHCRVADLLLELDEDSFPNPITCGHSPISIMLNLNRETVTEILNRFRRAGWLKLGYRQIHLQNRRMLLKIATTF